MVMLLTAPARAACALENYTVSLTSALCSDETSARLGTRPPPSSGKRSHRVPAESQQLYADRVDDAQRDHRSDHDCSRAGAPNKRGRKMAGTALETAEHLVRCRRALEMEPVALGSSTLTSYLNSCPSSAAGWVLLRYEVSWALEC